MPCGDHAVLPIIQYPGQEYRTLSVFGNHKSDGTVWYLDFRCNSIHELDQLVKPFQFPILFLFPNPSAFDTAINIYDGRVFWPMSSGLN